jgi:hypothetical protein
MPKLTVISRYFSTFDTVEIAPDATIESDGNQFKAVFPSSSPTNEYIVSKYPVQDGEIEIPEDSIIATIQGTKAFVLVPKEQYE